MRNRVKELRQVRAGDLLANPKNWRKHPPAQRQAMVAMFEKVGIAGAVVARETEAGLELVDGHLRADIDPEIVLPVAVVDLTEEEAAQILATMDPLGAMAEADLDDLAKLLDELDEDLPDQIDFGDLYGLGKANASKPPAEETSIDPPTEPRTKQGEVWTLGRHRLMCGDCTITEHVATLLDGQSPDCVLTDPPYSSGSFQEAGKSRGSKGTDAQYRPIANDVLTVRRTANELHATQKPVELLEILLDTTPFARSVYDPFAGSGSTLMAADRLRRRAYLMEIDPAYCDVIVARWERVTGGTAKRQAAK